MSLPVDAGLSLEQAPPLAIPAGFFLLAPVAVAAAGGLLLFKGAGPLASGGTPGSGALAHLGTLGFLGSVMLGALYQMIPVVAGSPVPVVRLAHVVHGLWALGVALLVAAFLVGTSALWLGAGAALGGALVGFCGPVGLALAKAPSPTWTRTGMRVAVLTLAVAASLGLAFVALRGAGWMPPGYHPLTWKTAHLGLGLSTWVGGLMIAVSWQVLPMFYMAEEVQPRVRAGITLCAGATLVLVPAALLSGGGRGLVIGALVPAAIAAWLLHPLFVIPSLRARRRKRRDESLTGWLAALSCAPLTGGLALAAVLWPSPRLGVAFVVLAVWGWAGFALHGMLCRIVPFLVWFHRLSPHIGEVPVPPMRKLLSQERIRRALMAHGLSLVLLLGAVALGSDLVARGAGLALVATAALLGANLVSVLRVRGPVIPMASPATLEG